MYEFFSFSGLILGITSILMAIIMMRGGMYKKNYLWAALCICMSILGFSIYQIGLTRIPEVALFWWRFSYLGVVFTPVLVLHTLYIILRLNGNIGKYILLLCYGLSIFFFLCNISGILITEVTLIFEKIYFDTPMNIFFQAFLIYFNTIFTYIFYLLWRSYRGAREKSVEVSSQIIFFGVGIACGAIGGYAVFLPLFGIYLYPYASILMALYPLIMGYSILNHHLFDARYAVLQIIRIIGIGAVVSSVAACISIISIYTLSYRPHLHSLEAFLLVGLFFLAIYLYTSEGFSRLFLISSLRALDRESRYFIEKSGVYRNIRDLLSDLENLFGPSLGISRVEILSPHITIKYPYTVAYLEKYKKPLIRSELEAEDIEGEEVPLLGEVSEIGEAIFRLEGSRASDLYFLVLGPKRSDEYMTDREIIIISRILPRISLALQILDFHRSLEEEVSMQTKIMSEKNKELESAYKKLQAIDTNKDNFLAIASHELRTPMTIIKGYADLFLRNTLGEITESQRKYILKIYSSTESLIELINNILDISKIEAGRMEIARHETLIHEILLKSIEEFGEIYSEKSLKLSLDDRVTRDKIIMDEGKLKMIITNLLSNAYKFTPSGGTVHMSVDTDIRNLLTISISDTGIGIPTEKLSSLFEKFSESTSDGYMKKTIKGTGLGLNLTKQLITLLGGSIRVISKEGKGTTFFITLPI